MNNIIIKKDSKILFLGDSITDVKFNNRKKFSIKGKNIYRTEFICSNDRLLSNKGFYYQRAYSYDKQYDGICWELRAGNYNASWADIQNVTIKSKAYDKYDNYQETTTIKVRELS